MEIHINASQTLGPLPHFWRSTGFTPASWLLKPEMRQTLTYLGSLPRGGLTHVRIHYLLDLVQAKGLGAKTPQYDWARLDTGLDYLVRQGLKPFFELMGNPSDYFSDFNDNAQLHTWKRLVRDLAEHLMARYGQSEVESWYFETWNEPDIGWWHQWPEVEPFCNYYDACSEGLREANPDLKLGGPGTCVDLSTLFRAFLLHCERGTNYFTGKRGTRLDFISVHVKGQVSHQEDLTPCSSCISHQEQQIYTYIYQNHLVLKTRPFMNNECDPQVGWGQIHTWRATPYYAALVAKVINQHIHWLIDGTDCTYALLSNDNGFLGTWGNRTLLARLGTKAHIERGDFELIKKPVLNAMTLLALLGDTRCVSNPPQDPNASLGILATRRGDGEVAILLYHSADRITQSGTKSITLHIEGLPFTNGKLTHYRIDETHSNPFTIWEASQGFRQEHLTPEVLAALRRNQEPAQLKPPSDFQAPHHALTLTFDLPLPGLSLVALSAKPTAPPAGVEDIRAERYTGIHDGHEHILLAWRTLDPRGLHTYEVLCAASPDGPYRRINLPDLISSAFLHMRPVTGQPKYYCVQAIDHWDRRGARSKVIKI